MEHHATWWVYFVNGVELLRNWFGLAFRKRGAVGLAIVGR